MNIDLKGHCFHWCHDNYWTILLPIFLIKNEQILNQPEQTLFHNVHYLFEEHFSEDDLWVTNEQATSSYNNKKNVATIRTTATRSSILIHPLNEDIEERKKFVVSIMEFPLQLMRVRDASFEQYLALMNHHSSLPLMSCLDPWKSYWWI